ncbi:hypothetical protein [Acinetobacter sp. SWBY1]|uniref:hypothetical protein n=1 Tax=Acinetobacter sp. SWBY1 TaxID=2079596 RepID=UPI000CF25698|nr:hypothetical protein [Acinetobacter sp. SWBY1]AVH49013.1 hypothetical protein C3Y93_04895 [Acinetobacter sp. SWBY1]
MTNLISGKEALIALANGEEVENFNGSAWWGVDKSWEVGAFLSDRKFRLKPRTITINGVEVPACGENYKEGEEVYVLDDCCDERGYIEYSASGYQYQKSIPKLWWRTEDEIKQVVAALRQIFGGV